MEGKPISRAVAEQRMLRKLSRSLTDDIALLLPADIQFDDEDAINAFNHVWTELMEFWGHDTQFSCRRFGPWNSYV